MSTSKGKGLKSAMVARGISQLVAGILFWLIISGACVFGGEQNKSVANVVDWYRPLPEQFRGLETEISIPTELIRGVHPKHITEAIKLLRDAEVVEIAPSDAKYFSSVGDPKAVITVLLRQKRQKLHFFSERMPDSREKYASTTRNQLLASDQRIIAGLKKEINNYEGWQQSLVPYLIRAVSLGDTAAPFFAGMMSDNLFISHLGLGSRMSPMQRMPVVAYLPKKPRHVYHSATMMQ